ncbi:MAG: phospholipase D family protein, partial [Acidobacteriota bacterium]
MKYSPNRLRFLASVLVFLSVACASLPSDYPPPPQSAALAPDPTTSLASYAAKFARLHGSGASGFAAVDPNSDGLLWRLAMVDSAEQSIDMLYYVWYADPGGLLLLEHVMQAAERGVRVRVVVDDTLFLKGKQGLANLSAHPNIEIRIFNPWATKGISRGF